MTMAPVPGSSPSSGRVHFTPGDSTENMALRDGILGWDTDEFESWVVCPSGRLNGLPDKAPWITFTKAVKKKQLENLKRREECAFVQIELVD